MTQSIKVVNNKYRSSNNMRSLLYLLVLLMVLCSPVLALEYVSYEGLRLDMSALTLNRDIISTIIPALNRTQHSAFYTYKEKGSFGSELKIKNVKITYYKINEERFDLNSYEYEYPIYRLKGAFESIYFHISFHYEVTWLGIPVNTGTGSAAVTNVKNEILVFWNETDPDVQLPHPWDIRNITLSSWFPPTKWVTELLHKKFIHDFHNAIDHSMYDFAHNLLKTYRYIEDIFPDNIDLIFRNDILWVTPTVNGSYLSISFKTNITVNGHVHKKMYRRMNSTVVPRGDFDYCLAAELVPDVMDAMGKGGYNDKDEDPKKWGFESNTIKEFFNILPSLKETYKGDEVFIVHCQSSRFETVNDVTQKGWTDPLLELQNPVYCMFSVEGHYFLSVDTFMRFYYELKCKNESFYAHIRAALLKDFKTVPLLPEARKELLAEKVEAYTHTFYDTELLSPGIKVMPNRHDELIFDWAYTKNEEICFYYREKRPSLSNSFTHQQQQSIIYLLGMHELDKYQQFKQRQLPILQILGSESLLGRTADLVLS
eukprot:TRINITY_DN3201_c0_g1_i1.p1 TRINITY_DN3201_c0_g1~~TRINITY_DN3201_c0_g1_i1.p1  ORF type:complete len:541 (-),score=20.30 TRINITY_DN3201_c0_g1_i1:368-1990(-)